MMTVAQPGPGAIGVPWILISPTLAAGNPPIILVELFLRHPDQVLSREQLLSHVWGYDFDPASNVIDVYVGYLRKKLGPQAIQTVRGVGYRLVP